MQKHAAMVTKMHALIESERVAFEERNAAQVSLRSTKDECATLRRGMTVRFFSPEPIGGRAAARSVRTSYFYPCERVSDMARAELVWLVGVGGGLAGHV
jgi:hypothetical protein